MTEVNAFADTPWRAGVIQDFARSELFDRTFEEGMQLVEETAAYLDGAGRHDSKILSRNAALGYAADAKKRELGFIIQMLATAVLLFGALGRAIYVYAVVGA